MSTLQETLRVGAAKVDITPPDLTELNPMGGSFTAVHDRIYGRALVLADGETEIALVTTDLIEVGDMTPLRRRIQDELGINFDHILITASHTHSAPRIGLVSPGALAHGGGPESAAYTAWVYDSIVDALRAARAAAQPARFGIGMGSADVNVNRDQYVNGQWIMGVDPDGPSDKSVWVLTFESTGGNPIAVVMNYAVHSTAALWTREISGDLAGAAARYVERELGQSVIALWTLGAVGDQNPRVSLGQATDDADRDRAFAAAAADAQGLIVGAEVVRIAQGIDRTTSFVRLAAREVVVKCPAKRGLHVMEDMKQEDVDTVDLRLLLLMINEVAVGGVSGEVTTRILTRLRRESPSAQTILVSMANDRIGYLPEDEAYDRYTFEANGSPVKQGYGESSIVDGLVNMIETELRSVRR